MLIFCEVVDPYKLWISNWQLLSEDILHRQRTTHSRFQIPINVTDSSTCGIKHGSQIAELMTKASLIIWDEAPMAHRNCFEAVDRSLRDILRFSNSNSGETPFGGKTIVLGGDFREILPVVSKEIGRASCRERV